MFTVPSNSSPGSVTASRDVPPAVYAAAWNVVLSAMRVLLTLLLHDDDSTGFTGDRAADVDQVAFGVDLLDAKMSLRMTMIAVVARHLLSLDDAGRIGSRSDGTRTA